MGAREGEGVEDIKNDPHRLPKPASLGKSYALRLHQPRPIIRGSG